MKQKLSKLLKKQENTLKGGEIMDDMVLKELNAIEKLLKSYEMVNSSLENRVRILEFSLKKLKEEISNLKSNGLKDEELKND